MAASKGYTKIVKSLLESKADPNKGYRSTDSDGEVHVTTPLYAAAEQESTEVVRILLANGARQDVDTGGGELDIHHHCYCNCTIDYVFLLPTFSLALQTDLLV